MRPHLTHFRIPIERRRSQRSAANEVADPRSQPDEKQRQVNRSRRRQIQPVTRPLDDLAQGERFRADGVQRLAGECRIAQAPCRGLGKVVGMDRLELLVSAADKRGDEWKTRQSANYRCASIAALGVDE